MLTFAYVVPSGTELIPNNGQGPVFWVVRSDRPRRRTNPSCTIGGALRQPLWGFHCPDRSKALSRRTLRRWNRLRLASSKRQAL